MSNVKITRIISLRGNANKAFYDVCYEWENILSEKMNAAIRCFKPYKFFYRRAVGKAFPNSYSLKQNLDSTNLSVYFVMYTKASKYYTKVNGIPIFLDVWSEEELNILMRKTEGLQLYYVTSLDVLRKIKEKKADAAARYMPLSVSDQYFSSNFIKYKEKAIDVIQLGRRNPILHEYMMQYISENPEIEYLYAIPDGNLKYISTKRGSIGKLNTREEFIRTLASSRVSLVSSPAIDHSRKDIEEQFGVDCPTPRFYESAVLGCAMVGRYTMNEEMKKQNIPNVCDNVHTYEEFKESMDRALKMERTELWERYEGFIRNNLTSVRAQQIMQDLKEIDK